MLIGVPKERLPNEARVAATPKTVEQLLKLGFRVAIEQQAGQAASFEDSAYQQAGAELVDREQAFQADIVLRHADRLYLAREKSGADGKAGRTQDQCNGDGCGAAYFARAVA